MQIPFSFHYAPTLRTDLPRTLARSGRGAIVLVVAACILAVLVIAVVISMQGGNGNGQTIMLQTVERGDFEAFVTEPGDISSSSNVEIRCRVRSRGYSGTAILKICDEGTVVQPDDFLVQFDDSVLQQDLLAQKIVVTNDKAALIQAQSNLENAKRKLREYEQGLFALERDMISIELFVAEEMHQRSVTYLEYSRRLHDRGYITTTQLNADQFAVEKAKKDLDSVKRKLNVYDMFTRDKMVGEYGAEIKKQEANVEAATYRLELSEQKLAEIQEQIGFCMVLAPAPGQVVYANERERNDAAKVIEEGALIRENQLIIQLPDLSKMQVDVKVNESHVNRVKKGQPARIILDADPGNVLEGTVDDVDPYPFPIRWHGAPMEYGTVVTINNPPPTIRPGLRAKVKIVFESLPDVLQVPLASIMEKGDRHYCLVQEQNGWQLRQVVIGSNNNSQVVIHQGLSEGEQVAMTPFEFIKRSDLPELDPSEAVAEQQPDRSADSNAVVKRSSSL